MQTEIDFKTDRGNIGIIFNDAPILEKTKRFAPTPLLKDAALIAQEHVSRSS